MPNGPETSVKYVEFSDESVFEHKVRWFWPDRLFSRHTLPIVQVGLEDYLAHQRDGNVGEAGPASSGGALICPGPAGFATSITSLADVFIP